MLASVVWIVSGFAAALIPEGEEPGSSAFGSPSFPIEWGVYMVALVGVLGGIVGLQALRATRHRWLGTARFSAALVGTLLAVADMAMSFLGRGGVFDQLLGARPSGTLIGIALIGTGVVLLGVTSLQAGTLPRWCAVPLIIAPPVSGFLGCFSGGMVLGLVWLTLGAAIWVKGGEET
jgi:hypothetical protein